MVERAMKFVFVLGLFAFALVLAVFDGPEILSRVVDVDIFGRSLTWECHRCGSTENVYGYPADHESREVFVLCHRCAVEVGVFDRR